MEAKSMDTYWEYDVILCTYEKDKKNGKDKEFWSLLIDGEHHYMIDGLDLMGSHGWELIAQHPLRIPSGEKFSLWYHPDYWFIFKRPVK